MKVRPRRRPWCYAKLPAHEHVKVDEGNRALRILLVVDALNGADVPWIWEIPATSMMWLVPGVRRHLKDPTSVRIVADHCGFGARWRKRTVFLCHGLPDMFLGRLRLHGAAAPHPVEAGFAWGALGKSRGRVPSEAVQRHGPRPLGPAHARFYNV